MPGRYRITVSRCPDGHRTHPPRADCPHCGADMTPTVTEGHGTVVSWTRIERPPEGFTAPRVVVLVRLDPEDDATSPPLVLAAVADATRPVRSGDRMRIRETADRTEAEPD